MEWAQKQELLKQGIVPKEMREVIKKPKPKPGKKECQSTLKRPTSARPSTVTLTATQAVRYSGLRTTTAIDPQASTLKPIPSPVRPSEETPLDSLKRLDEAMNQLELAMMSAIDTPGYSQHQYDTRGNQGDAEEEIVCERQYFTQELTPEKTKYEDSEVSESSIFSLSPDHSQENFYPKREIRPGKQELGQGKTVLKWEENEPEMSVTVSPDLVLEGYDVRTRYPPETEDVPLAEPSICSVETADYLAQLLAQTRKDLEHMQIPEPICTLDSSSLPPAEPVLDRNYQSDLMPQPYTIKPIARELHNPVVRSGGRSSNSLAIGSSLGPAPQKYTGRDLR